MLQPSNIFLNEVDTSSKLTVKIGDFGLIRHNQHITDDTSPVSPLTPAPGIVEGGFISSDFQSWQYTPWVR